MLQTKFLHFHPFRYLGVFPRLYIYTGGKLVPVRPLRSFYVAALYLRASVDGLPCDSQHVVDVCCRNRLLNRSLLNEWKWSKQWFVALDCIFLILRFYLDQHIPM